MCYKLQIISYHFALYQITIPIRPTVNYDQFKIIIYCLGLWRGEIAMSSGLRSARTLCNQTLRFQLQIGVYTLVILSPSLDRSVGRCVCVQLEVDKLVCANRKYTQKRCIMHYGRVVYNLL